MFFFYFSVVFRFSLMIITFLMGREPILFISFTGLINQTGIGLVCKERYSVLTRREDQLSRHPGCSLLQQLIPSDLRRQDRCPVPHSLCHRPGPVAAGCHGGVPCTLQWERQLSRGAGWGVGPVNCLEVGGLLCRSVRYRPWAKGWRISSSRPQKTFSP